VGIICKYWDKFVSLQRQDGYFGYPGKFPERASRIRHYPILKQAASFGCGFAIFEKIRKSSLLLKENGTVRVRTWLAKKEQALQKGKRSYPGFRMNYHDRFEDMHRKFARNK